MLPAGSTDRMKRCYEVTPCGGEPRWNIPAAPIDLALWLPDPGLEAWAQACYTPDALHIRLFAREDAPLQRFTGENDMVCLDSCLEFFFCPLPGDTRYFNFEFNPNGALYLGFGHDRQDSVRQLVPNAKKLFCITPLSLPGAWGICFQIPVEFVKLYAPEFALYRGLRLGGNFYKCGEETQTPHYLAWNRVCCDVPDFHRPWDFGWLVF